MADFNSQKSDFNLLIKPAILVISGLDPTNGAGMGEDISVILEKNCRPLSLPSVLTLQNSFEFNGVVPVPIKYIVDSIELLKKEFEFSAVKIGLLPNDEGWLADFSQILKNFKIPTVIDPVFKATSDKSGDFSISKSYMNLLESGDIFLTPNLRELRKIYESAFNLTKSAEEMAKELSLRLNCSIIVTFECEKPLVMVSQKGENFKIPIKIFAPERSIHGTGCAFSSALASDLALGKDICKAVESSADFVYKKAIKSMRYNSKGKFYL